MIGIVQCFTHIPLTLPKHTYEHRYRTFDANLISVIRKCAIHPSSWKINCEFIACSSHTYLQQFTGNAICCIHMWHSLYISISIYRYMYVSYLHYIEFVNSNNNATTRYIQTYFLYNICSQMPYKNICTIRSHHSSTIK